METCLEWQVKKYSFKRSGKNSVFHFCYDAMFVLHWELAINACRLLTKLLCCCAGIRRVSFIIMSCFFMTQINPE